MNQTLMDRLNRSGDLYLTHTRLDGRMTLRLCVGQTNTDVAARREGLEADSGRSGEIRLTCNGCRRDLATPTDPGNLPRYGGRWACENNGCLCNRLIPEDGASGWLELAQPEGLYNHGYTLEAVKQWRVRESEEGRPSELDDFLRAHHLCIECRGNGKFAIGVRWRERDGE